MPCHRPSTSLTSREKYGWLARLTQHTKESLSPVKTAECIASTDLLCNVDIINNTIGTNQYQKFSKVKLHELAVICVLLYPFFRSLSLHV